MEVQRYVLKLNRSWCILGREDWKTRSGWEKAGKWRTCLTCCSALVVFFVVCFSKFDDHWLCDLDDCLDATSVYEVTGVRLAALVDALQALTSQVFDVVFARTFRCAWQQIDWGPQINSIGFNFVVVTVGKCSTSCPFDWRQASVLYCRLSCPLCCLMSLYSLTLVSLGSMVVMFFSRHCIMYGLRVVF